MSVSSASAVSGRVIDRLDQLFALGPGPHANRPGFSRAEQEAHELAADWMRDAGMDVGTDAAGNLIGRVVGEEPGAPEIWTGSHLDTVPGGGRFDGALGVVAGIEAAASLPRRPRRSVAVVAFRDEEGVRFGPGFFGSRALCGQVRRDELSLRDAGGTTLASALSSVGIERLPLEPTGATPGSFIELHIEQGPRLERCDSTVAIVDMIVGVASLVVEFNGIGGHAGTIPMKDRADALCAASEFTLAVRDAAIAIDGAVATVGSLATQNPAANVIPSRVSASVDIRAPDLSGFQALEQAVRCAADSTAERNGCHWAVSRVWRVPPIALARGPRAALARAIAAAGQPPVELSSGAGHDAGVLAAHGIESAMLFVRSLAGGVSHAPEEETDPEAIDVAIDVLGRALDDLAAR